ncbi:MAG: EpsI family protein [Betaproteobacteria bacterium]|nr:EpsI family protein [Betaproteobacteria bacterium]
MDKPFHKPFLLLLAMVVAAGLAFAATPTTRLADRGPKVDLEGMIPQSFRDWRIDDTIRPVLPAPDVQAKLDRIYNQTLARTYVNSAGQRIMLSIAYGGDQSDAMRVHRPEVCYTAQGFEVRRARLDQLKTGFGILPITRLLATQGSRNEPITYWVTVGERATYADFRQKLAQMKYGFSGRIPDGMLIRASSIDRDEKSAFQTQDDFIRAMLGAMTPSGRTKIAGRLGDQ